MCLTCGKHVTERLWYLEPEKHRLRSLGLFRDAVSYNLNPLLISAIKLVRKKQPYGADRLTGISRSLLDWFGKTIHGIQALPDLDSAFKVIDMANEVSVIPCICKKVLAPDLPPAWKCIGLNIAAQVHFRREAKEPVRAINKQQAKDIATEWRQKGAFQSAGWLWDANVIWLCNCDEHCGSHRASELEWALVPSIVAASLVRPELCQRCHECAKWCTRADALTFDQDGRAVINEALCRGCGLCIEHCPTKALGFVPRRTFYDVLNKVIRPVGKGVIKL